MSGQWKPGDVALLTFKDGTEAVGVRHERGYWNHSGEWGSGSSYDEIGGHEARPLVVIDPEDAEAVERLVCALENLTGHANGLVAVHMADALREFANPTPPKPDEPQGLGAVVRDAEGKRWVGLGNTFAGGQRRWQSVEGLTFSTYRTIDAVEVLSEGVTP